MRTTQLNTYDMKFEKDKVHNEIFVQLIQARALCICCLPQLPMK